MKKRIVAGCVALIALTFAAAASCPAPTAADLAAAAAAEMRRVVRPGGVEGRPFWNANCSYFMYPPAFDFKDVPNAATYAFSVIDDLHHEHRFEAPTPRASLLPVWEKVRDQGFVTVRCTGLDDSGRPLGEAGCRRLFKKAPYRPGSYPPAARSYADCAGRVYDYLAATRAVRNFVKSGMPPGYDLYCYPSKMIAALTTALLRRAERVPEAREESEKSARVMLDYLLGESFGDGAAWSGCPPTYGPKTRADAKEIMTVYPASVGMALLQAATALKETRYLDAAVKIGETYLKMQGEDGTWCLKVNGEDGRCLTKNRLVPSAPVPFLEALARATGKRKYGESADRAFAYVEKKVLASWNWEGQFEDTAPSRPYENLTKHDACWTAMELLRRYPEDRERMAEARELLRFAEDQFVFWEKPTRRDGEGMMEKGLFLDDFRKETWTVPTVIEQWPTCAWPIDSSVAKLIRTYLALYRAEGNPLDLAKAKTLGDVLTRVQEPSGRIPTFMVDPHCIPGDSMGPGGKYPYGWVDWLNCMAASAEALDELSQASLRSGME